MHDQTGSQDEESWLPVPVSGRPLPGQSMEIGIIEPLVFARKRRRTPFSGFRLPFRAPRIIPVLVADQQGVHAGGLFAAWEQIQDVHEPELWHQHPRQGLVRGPGKVTKQPGTVSGLAMAITCAPPQPTVLLFQDDFEDPLTNVRLALLDLLANPTARPTQSSGNLPSAFPYMRGMDT